MKPSDRVYYCTGCSNPMEHLAPDGRLLHEGWYYWDGGTYCTKCWQRLGFHVLASQADYPK